MYAVIRAGGKQYKVTKGDVLDIEHVGDGSDVVEFVPLLVVDDKGKARSRKADLADARVTAKVLGDSKGPKVDVFKYRNKSRYRRHAGHRQRYTSIQIADIKVTGARAKSTASKAGKTDDGKETSKEVTDGS